VSQASTLHSDNLYRLREWLGVETIYVDRIGLVYDYELNNASWSMPLSIMVRSAVEMLELEFPRHDSMELRGPLKDSFILLCISLYEEAYLPK